MMYFSMVTAFLLSPPPRSGTKSPTFSNIDVFVAPPFNGLTTSLRLYHGLRLIPSNSQLAGQRITKTGHRQGVMLWRTLRSQFKSERRSLSDTSSPGLLGPFAFTVFVSCMSSKISFSWYCVYSSALYFIFLPFSIDMYIKNWTF